MIHAVLVLIRARLLITRNTLWRGKLIRKIGLILLVALVGLGSYGFYRVSRGLVELLTSPDVIEWFAREAARAAPELGIPSDLTPYLLALPSLALFFVLVLLVLTSFSSVLSSLYLSGDLDMLLVAPVPMRAVFIVKFFGGLVVPYLILFFLIGPALIGYGQGMGFGPAFFAAVVVVLALFPLLPAGIGALLVMVVVRVIPARRAREIVGVISGLLGVGWYLVTQFAPEIAPQFQSVQTLDSLRRLDVPLLPSAWAGRALIAAGQGEWLTLLVYGGLFAALSVGVFAGCLLLAEHLYYQGWSNMATQGGRIKTKSKEQRTKVEKGSFVLGPLLSVLPQESRAIVYKDLRVFPRDLRNVQQLIFPMVLAGVWIFRLATGGSPSRGGEFEFQSSLGTLSSAGLSFFICLTLSSALGGPGISREGKGFWLLKVAPISGRRLLLGKLALAYLPFPTLGVLFVAFLSVLQGSTPLEFARALALVLIAGLGTSSISLGLGAAFPKLDWENPQKQTTWQAGCLSPILYMTYVGIAAGVTIGVPLLGGTLAPNLATVLTVAAWLVFVGLTAAVVWVALSFGAGRLERLELA
jgi:ABC-2 type transport system permease protein